mmetsp:Transcript_1828/g.5334  ORF Transcript_1828/g.5334 Transcript_1828/m.5334 type:complete len:214 (+) Transcript_1828:144-785(+)
MLAAANSGLTTRAQTSLCRRTVIAMSASSPQPAKAIDFLTLLHNLKDTKRTGWMRKGIKGPESIADHMYRMSMMGMVCGADPETQVRCIKLAIVHDVAEAIVGDITPHDGVSDDEKYKLENSAIEKIRQTIGTDQLAGEEIEQLWHEYEQGTSPAAQLVKDFDKLEMILQAQEYEARQGVQLDEFFSSTDGKWRTDLGRAWAAEVVSRRKPPQ